MERPRRRQNSAWGRPLRRKSLRRALQRVSRISRRGMAWSPGRGLRPRPGYDRPRSHRFPDALHRTDSVGLELALLAFQSFDLLLQRRDAVEGIVMARLPISGLLAEFEVVALQAIDLGV